jgi:hypothetical protein
LVLAAEFQPLVVFIVAAIVALANIAACGWVDRQWDVWIAGTRFETRMQ